MVVIVTSKLEEYPNLVTRIYSLMRGYSFYQIKVITIAINGYNTEKKIDEQEDVDDESDDLSDFINSLHGVCYSYI